MDDLLVFLKNNPHETHIWANNRKPQLDDLEVTLKKLKTSINLFDIWVQESSLTSELD